MKKYIFLISLLAFTIFTFTVQAAPDSRIERTILPVLDSTYELGTTTRAWLTITTDELCLTADICRTTWPSSGSGTFSWTSAPEIGGVSTSTTLGFYNGFLSTASSTIDSNLTITGLLNVSSTTATSTFAGNADISGFLNIGEYINFTPLTSGNEPAYQEGILYYNDEDKSLAYFVDKEGVSNNIGRELFIRAKNVQGSAITDGQAVFISGSSGDNPEVLLAQGDAASTAEGTIGVVTQDTISDNGVGYITTYGRVRGIDTLSFTAGDIVYVATSTAGGLTNIKPKYPNIAHRVGVVIRSSATEGSIFVDPEFTIVTYTPGSVTFADSNGILGEDNANFSYSDTLNQLFVTNFLTNSATTTADHNFSSWLDLAETAAPASPEPNTVRISAQDNNGFGVLHYQNSTGSEFEILRDQVHIARNNTGSTINKGDVVYVNGSTGVVPTVAPALADSKATTDAYGFAVTDIDTASFGRVLTAGDLGGLDTSAFSDGDNLYLSTTTPGGVVNYEPVHPDIYKRVGEVIKSGAGSSGVIDINIQATQHVEDGTIENTWFIGNQTVGQDISLVFDNGTDRIFKWDDTNGWFDLSEGLQINGNATTTGTQQITSLTASRLVATDAVKNLVSTITESDLESSISDVTNILTNNDGILQDHTFPFISAPEWGATFYSTTTPLVFEGGIGVTASSTLVGTTTINANADTTNLTGNTYDLRIGTGDDGLIRFGNALIGTYPGIFDGVDYTGVPFIKTIVNPTSEISFVIGDADDEVRFALPESGANKGTYNPRSMIIAGPWPSGTESYITCSYWGFTSLDCNTPGTGADLGVQDDLQVLGTAYVQEQVRSSYFTATSTTATSTFKDTAITGLLDLQGSATSTASNGINLSSGCFAIGGNCIGGGGAGHDAVTLAGSLDYLTLSGQQITRNAIDLTTDVTGILPIANGGTATSTQITNGVNYFDGTRITSNEDFGFNGSNLSIGTTDFTHILNLKKENGDSAIAYNTTVTGGGGDPTSTATTSPGTAADGGGGNTAWTSIDNILASDNVYPGHGSINTAEVTNYAEATNFGFSIPTGATIDGIVVQSEASTDSNDMIYNSVRLIVGGTQVGDNKGANQALSLSDTISYFGGSADLWSLTPTVSEVNASNFGVAVQFECDDPGDCGINEANLDHVAIKVYYTPSGDVSTNVVAGVDSSDESYKISFSDTLGVNDYFTIASSTGKVSANNFEATSTTATSTFTDTAITGLLDLQGSATTTATNGINLASGCFAIAGTCIGGGGGAGHDPVTLAGALDYLTLSGQEITRNAIDLTTDTTGTLAIADGGTGATAFGANRIPYVNSGNTALTSSTGLIFDGTNLGVGDSPTQELEVDIDQFGFTIIKVNNDTTTGNTTGAGFQAAAGNGQAQLDFFAHGDGRTATRYGTTIGGFNEFFAGTGNGILFGTHTLDAPIIFGNNATERLRIDAGGNLGIASSTPGTLLSLGTGANAINLNNTATSTFKYGINLEGGCFAVGGVCISGGSGGGFDTAGTGLTSSGSTVDAVGGVGITANANDLAFDSTELSALTWSAGGSSAFDWTFNLSGTNPVLKFGSGYVGVEGVASSTQGLSVNGLFEVDSLGNSTSTTAVVGSDTSTATSTVSIGNTESTRGGCIEMEKGGSFYKIVINDAGTGLDVTAGTCK